MKRVIQASKLTSTKDLVFILPEPIVRYAEYSPGLDRLVTNQSIDVVQNILERQGGYFVDLVDSKSGKSASKTIYMHRGNTQIMLYCWEDPEDSFIELVNANIGDSVYRIYFNDSNQKLIQGRNMAAVLDYIDISTQYSIEDVVKIENTDWYK